MTSEINFKCIGKIDINTYVVQASAFMHSGKYLKKRLSFENIKFEFVFNSSRGTTVPQRIYNPITAMGFSAMFTS